MVRIENGTAVFDEGTLKSIGKDGSFQRKAASFRNKITPPGISGQFPAEAGRYHLYASHACPWANRVLIVRQLKGLADIIGLSIVHPYMEKEGWRFNIYDDSDPEVQEDIRRKNAPGSTVDHVHGYKYMHEVYSNALPTYTGRVTVPVLLDTKTGQIVNNESAEIIHMLNSAFNTLLPENSPQRKLNLAPENLLDMMEGLSDTIQTSVNNGVYRCGFARKQEPYDIAHKELFAALDTLDDRLATQRFLLGNTLTLVDIRLFVTLVRFDKVYFVHFKTNKRTIESYPNLGPYVRDIYQLAGVGSTIHMDQIAQHYYWSHPSINPFGIVAAGGHVDFDAPTDRTTKFTKPSIDHLRSNAA